MSSPSHSTTDSEGETEDSSQFIVDIHSEEFKMILSYSKSDFDRIVSSYKPQSEETKATFKNAANKAKEEASKLSQYGNLMEVMDDESLVSSYALDVPISAHDKERMKASIQKAKVEADLRCKFADTGLQMIEWDEYEFDMVTYIKNKPPIFTTFDSKEDIIDYVRHMFSDLWEEAEALARTLDNGGFHETQWCDVNYIQTSIPPDGNVEDFAYYILQDVMKIDGAYEIVFGTGDEE